MVIPISESAFCIPSSVTFLSKSTEIYRFFLFGKGVSVKFLRIFLNSTSCDPKSSIPGRFQKIRFTFWKLFSILYGMKLSVNSVLQDTDATASGTVITVPYIAFCGIFKIYENQEVQI